MSKKYPGVAAQSQSIFCKPEPRNTKFIMGCVLDYIFSSFKSISGRTSFVQVGSNDGIRGDKISHHVRKSGWTGLLIEPVNEAMSRLRKTYSGCGGLFFHQVAIWSDEGVHPFHVVCGEDVISSFSLETIMLHELKYENLQSMIEVRPTPTRRLDLLCRETGFEKPDFLIIDAEGCDDIVLQTFDFNRHRPAIVFFEHVALSRENSRSIRDFLYRLGYEIIYDRHDCLCMLREAFDKDFVAFLERLLREARDN
jgi:FkbM family methyltransferase